MKKIKKKLPTVIVAVSAYNEGRNIKRFLESIVMQKEEGFTLDAIWVYSDGSTDKTVEMAKSVKSEKIKIMDDKKRLGKSTRLNDIYKKIESDFLVQSDADVVFAHKYVVRDILKPLLEDSTVGMCGGHPTPVAGVTFTERAINYTFEVYARLRKDLRGGNNIFSVDGRLLAYRKELIKQIRVPKDMIANDVYTFFCCIAMGFEYKYVPSAVVRFRSPQSLKDQVRQNTRFIAAPIRMGRFFSEKVVKREYYIPKLLLAKYMLHQFVNNPAACAYIYIVNLYCKIKARQTERSLTAKWAMAQTTKQNIQI